MALVVLTQQMHPTLGRAAESSLGDNKPSAIAPAAQNATTQPGRFVAIERKNSIRMTVNPSRPPLRFDRAFPKMSAQSTARAQRCTYRAAVSRCSGLLERRGLDLTHRVG